MSEVIDIVEETPNAKKPSGTYLCITLSGLYLSCKWAEIVEQDLAFSTTVIM